jgi:lipopolysaccharide export LptBFGC system permease protein LptF
MPLYAAYDNRMVSPLVMDMTENHSSVRRRLEADYAELKRNDPDRRSSEWIVSNARIWTYDREGRLAGFESRPGQSVMEFEEDLQILLSRDKEPEEMNMGELATHVRLLREREQPVSGLTTDLFLKTGFPLGTLFLVIIAFSYGVRMRPGNLTVMMSRGLAWVFGFYGFSALSRGLGYGDVVHPAIAAFLPLVVLAGVSVYMIGRSARWHG